MIWDILKAIIVLGIPVMLMSWYLTSRLQGTGHLTKGEDYKTVKSNLSSLKETYKSKPGQLGLLESKWMKFGGGYYGITALTTLVLVELGDAFHFVFNFPGLGELLDAGIISFVIDLLVNQLENFITALLWFLYWSEDGSILVWLLVPYGAYLCGLHVSGKSWSELRQEFAAITHRDKPDSDSE
jgi:hypothetical protein